MRQHMKNCPILLATTKIEDFFSNHAQRWNLRLLFMYVYKKLDQFLESFSYLAPHFLIMIEFYLYRYMYQKMCTKSPFQNFYGEIKALLLNEKQAATKL